MKKLFVSLLVLIFLGIVGSVGVMYYVRPDAMLTLEHQPVPVKQKAMDMVKRMSLDMVLTEEDVNNVLKKSLAQNPQRSKDVEVRGARFTLAGDRMIADYSLVWKQRVSAGVRVTYRLAWQAPDITATVEEVKLKDIGLPRQLVDDLSVPIGNELPKPLKIKDVRFGTGKLILSFQKPKLTDLQNLLS